MTNLQWQNFTCPFNRGRMATEQHVFKIEIKFTFLIFFNDQSPSMQCSCRTQTFRAWMKTKASSTAMKWVDAKLLQIMPKLQILLDKGNVTFYKLNNNKRKRFRLLNFLPTAILDFMTSLHCLCCWKGEALLFETMGQCSDAIKSKMAACEKLKALIISIYYNC